MKRDIAFLLFSIGCLAFSVSIAVYGTAAVEAACRPSTSSGPTLIDPTSAGCFGALNCPVPSDIYTLTKAERRTITWPDGYSVQVDAQSNGDCKKYYPNCTWPIERGRDDCLRDPGIYYYAAWSECWPDFCPPEYLDNGT